MAACCSNLNRSRMLVLVSINMAMVNGRSVSRVKLVIVCGLLSSVDLQVLFFQIGYQLAFSVGNRKQHVHQIDVNDQVVRAGFRFFLPWCQARWSETGNHPRKIGSRPQQLPKANLKTAELSFSSKFLLDSS